MKNSKIKKICALLLTAVLGTSVLAGCGGSDSSSGSSEQNLIHNLGTEVKTIDPALNNAVDGSIVIANAFEGLYRMDENLKPVPGVAESYTVSDDKLVYTFKLRKDAKWSDGKEVTAEDFKYSWTRALDPKVAADYAFQLYYIKGAEEFNTGKGKAEDLGIKVVDPQTLEVTLKNPTPYFLELTAFPTYMPVRKDIVEANKDTWTQKADTYVSNGPFKMTNYTMKDSYEFVKNDNYWNKDSVKLDKLTFKMLADETAAYAAVKNGEMHVSDKVPSVEIEKGKEEGLVQIFDQLGTYFYAINVNNNTDKLDSKVREALSKKEVRQALNLAINREQIVKEVAKGGQTPAWSFVPKGIKSEDGKEFADKQYWNPEDNDANIAKAKELLAKAGYKDGNGLPEFELAYNTDEGNKAIAEAIQQMWAKIGVKVKLTNQEWAVFQDARKNGNYQIARHGWVGDYLDPMTFLDMWMTGLGNNDPKFANKDYDELIRKAMKETDVAKRKEALRQAEDILMDEMPIIPIYYYTQVKAVDSKVKGFVVSPLGQVYYDKAYIE
ncbi:peptide ABC transporter substrate-binding protein [Clostridium nitritogenes]|uniref:Peptide ABC transporter substrate-binding protein n=1 Tax=Clostridium nitritogenes TaxID=83340 RepID=A0ABN1LKF6_9CLOT